MILDRLLGAVVCTQPQFIRLAGDGYAGLLGEERAKRVVVTREWLENSVVVALSSDAPSTPWYTPHATLIGAVARLTYSNKTYEPDQCLTIQEALRAHTMGSAYAGHEEQIKGSIEVGKLANLVVWSTDPYTATLKQLWEMVAEMTVVGGEIVHQIWTPDIGGIRVSLPAGRFSRPSKNDSGRFPPTEIGPVVALPGALDMGAATNAPLQQFELLREPY